MDFEPILIFVLGWITGLISDLIANFMTERSFERRDIRQKRMEKAYDPLVMILDKYKVKLLITGSIKEVVTLLESLSTEMEVIPISLLLEKSYEKALETYEKIWEIRKKIFLKELESLDEIKQSLVVLIDELNKNVKKDFYSEEKDC
jgi:hypothetical protein